MTLIWINNTWNLLLRLTSELGADKEVSATPSHRTWYFGTELREKASTSASARMMQELSSSQTAWTSMHWTWRSTLSLLENSPPPNYSQRASAVTLPIQGIVSWRGGNSISCPLEIFFFFFACLQCNSVTSIYCVLWHFYVLKQKCCVYFCGYGNFKTPYRQCS